MADTNGERIRASKFRGFACYSSVAVLAALGAGRAQAQCAPNPSQAYQATDCSGTQTGGYIVTTDQSPLTVDSGASIQNSGDALTVSIPANSYYNYRSTAITVNGSIASSGGNGILIDSGMPDQSYYGYSGISGTITVGAGGSIAGATGITLSPYPGNASSYAVVSISLDNSGSVAGTGGIALATTGGYASFSTITNESTGSIGAIAASFGTLNNHGTVTNSGTGQAVSGTYVTVQNYAGATIAGGTGGAAIVASSSLQLTNAGTINGDVITTGSGFVDSSLGTINGNVTFGSGSNTLVGTIANGAVQTGITGTITGGAGGSTVNTLQISSAADTTLSSSLALPVNFTQLAFAPASGTTLTLANGFSNPGTISYQGPGMLTNATTLSGNGQIVSEGFFSSAFTNTGSISTNNLGGLAAVALMGYASLDNSGSITATGDAVTGQGYSVSNSGTITAGGTAVQAFLQSFSNSGSIISTGGTALMLSTACTCTAITNSGTISGATIGAQLDDGVLNNSGTITSPGYGIAVSFYTNINNLAGGVISGGTVAIGNPSGTANLVVVRNAGTIDGDVNLVNGGVSSYNIFDAAPGGVLNGNLALGSEDTLIAELVNPGLTGFAGVNGTVTASDSNLIYVVRADATVASATPAGFDTVSFALTNNPALTLSAGSAYTGTLQIAGAGTVDLDGTITTTDATALFSSANLYQLNNLQLGAGLSLVNNGSIATTINMQYGGGYTAVVLGYLDTLTNTGTISLTDTSGGNPYITEAAVTGGASVTNSGTISGAGTGAIAFGGYGYAATPQLVNSGTITSDGVTVTIEGAATIANSGTIASTGRAAIGEPNNYAYGVITVNNLAGGVISGTGDAIELSGGTVGNAGTIDGNVNLAYSPYGYGYYGAGAYYDNGGTLNGNLTLNPFEALVIAGASAGTGPLGGVTGTINANGAALVYNVTSNTTASASGGASGFGAVGYLISNNAALTLDASSNLTTTLALAGGGSVAFNGTIATNDTLALISQYSSLLTATGTTAPGAVLNITNNGTITTGADANFSQPVTVSLGQNDTLINNGTISLVSANPAPGYAAVSGGASVTNAGTIFASNATAVNIGNFNSSGETVTNSGIITSNLLAISEIGQATVTNSGSITSTGGAAIGLANVYGYYSGYPVDIVNQASGVISGVGDAIDVAGGTVSNAGTIDGNVNLAYSTYGYYYGNSGTYADNGGTLNGNLTLNANQALVIDGANPGAGPLGGVTGTINANGAALIFDVSSDASTSAGSNGTSGFGTVGYLLSNKAKLTIAAASNLTCTLSVAGSGSVILNGTIATSDAPGLVSQASALFVPGGLVTGSSALTITNNGIITTSADASVSFPVAVTLGENDTLINNGTISLTNNNPQNLFAATISGGLSVINTGTIAATNASAIYLGNGNSLGATINNSGSITSNLLAVTETGAGTIMNSGTIVSTGGAAIGLGPYYGFFGGYSAQVDNLTGGVITGQGDAIDLDGGIVSNAGTINGNVNLASGFQLYAPGAYYDNGGTLNGNLTLGQYLALVVDYGAIGNPLGGITGTINANGAALFYNLTTDATITPAPTAAGFASVGYQLSNNAALTLPNGTVLTQTLGLTGQGTVILNGSIVTSNQAAVMSVAPFAINANAPATTALTITNNGSITAATDDADVYVNAAVTLGSGDTLVNNGTISRTNLGSADIYETAVSGGLSITNSGTIMGVGVSAVGATGYYTNGVGGTITNSGTITSDQFAILIGGAATIANSGTITSTGSAAISLTNFYPSGSAGSGIDNLGGGVISGVGDAIDLTGGQVANAGTINGNVDLAHSYYGGAFNFVSGAYFNNGGTLNGNLTLGSDQSLYTGLGSVDSGNIGNAGSVQGITGTVTPNSAYLIYLVSADGLDSVTTPAGFGGIGYQLSNNATLTLSPAATLTTQIDLSGTGSVIFNGSIATVALPAIISSPDGTLAGAATTPNDLTITNNGTLSTALQSNIYFKPSTVSLTSGDTLINTGAIVLINATGEAFPTAAAVYGGAVLTNSGTISGTGANAVSLGVPSTSVAAALSLTNSGSITSDLLAVQTNGAATITNSGTISGDAGALLLGRAAQIVNSGSITSSTGVAIAGTGAGTLITNQANGVIAGSGDAIDLLGGTVANSGTINGNVNLAFGAAIPSGPLSGGYFATGGTLNGNFTLGQGEALVTDLANPSAGITGTVTASGAALIYNVYATTTSTAALPTGFTSLAYQLFNGPVLTLASGSNLATTLALAGSGAVVFDGTIATTDAAALVSQPVLTATGSATTANALAITNNGTIAATFDISSTVVPGAVALGSDDTLTNTGTIMATNSGTIAPNLAVISGGQAITNFGTISGLGLGGIVLGSSSAGAALLPLMNSGTITSDQYGVLVQGSGRTMVMNTGTISGNLAAIVVTGTTELDNYATITSSNGPAVLGQGTGATKIVNTGGVISGNGDAIDLAGGFLDNAGRIVGNVNLGYTAGNTTPGIYIAAADGVGTLAGNLSFSSANGGNELIETGAGFGVTGTISGGSGTNYVGHSIGFNDIVTLGKLPTGFSVELTYVDGASHQVTLTGPANYAANIYVGGNGAIVNQANTSGIVTGLAASGEVYLTNMGGQLASFTNQAQVGGIALATNTLANGGTVGSATTAAPALTQTVNGTLSFTNSGTIVARPGVGIASPRAVLITGSLTGASQIANSGTITGGLAVTYVPAAGAALSIGNTGTIFGGPADGTQDRALAVLPAELPGTAGDTVLVTNSGTITGDILLAAASNVLVDAAGGSIRGNIILRPSGGTDSITLAGNFVGSIDGGQGPTSLTVSGGSAAQPVAFAAIAGITGYSQTGGFATLAGMANVGNATIAGGTFVGLAGSSVNASVTVGSGATFASGGTVNGNLTVGGTLHVGTSPDTLTVGGNVALASGSTSIFEVSPTASSKLVVSGQVAIGSSAALQIVQLQPLAPGAAIDLIDATGGITGKFATITGINAAFVEQGDTISVRALFNVGQAANPQAARGADYLNALIVSGAASPVLLAAFPALQTAGGPPITAAFARLTPEPYATAEQIGVENALILSRSLRDLDFDAGMHSGKFFTFGEALGNRRGLQGNTAIGTSDSSLSGYGFIGGLGVGGPAASLGAFGGYIDQTQTIGALAASTHAKGFVGGVTGRLARGPVQLNVSAIRDDAHASTQRQSPDNFALTAHYKLHSWTLDGELATSVRLGDGWAARPHVGVTWVWTRRGTAVEDNLSPFALTVARDRHDAGFVDGGVRFDAASEAVGQISPYVDLGVRYKLNGRAVEAVASIDGGPVTLFSAGDHRRRTSGLVEAGIRYRVNPAVSLFLTGNGDFSRNESSGTATGGVTVRF